MSHMNKRKRKKKDDLERNPVTPLSMKFKGDESGFLLPGRFVKAWHGLKGHPLANGTALGRTESNSIGLSSCQKPLGSRVKTSFPGSRAEQTLPIQARAEGMRVGQTRTIALRGAWDESSNNSIIKIFVWTWWDRFYKPLFFHMVVNKSHQPSSLLSQLLTALLLHQHNTTNEIFVIVCKCIWMFKLPHQITG